MPVNWSGAKSGQSMFGLCKFGWEETSAPRCGFRRKIRLKWLLRHHVINVESKISPQDVIVHLTGRSYRLTSQMKAQLLNNGGEPNPTLIWTNQNSYLSHWPSFSFYQFGEWVDIHVDRRLPANRASDALKLLYSKRSKKDLDWWCPLLEKAYAKENFTQLHVFSVCNGIFHEFWTHLPLMQYPIMLELSTFGLIYFRIDEE